MSADTSSRTTDTSTDSKQNLQTRIDINLIRVVIIMIYIIGAQPPDHKSKSAAQVSNRVLNQFNNSLGEPRFEPSPAEFAYNSRIVFDIHTYQDSRRTFCLGECTVRS